MAVHTEMRREIVENLAAFMRGEITRAAFAERVNQLLEIYDAPTRQPGAACTLNESPRDDDAACLCGQQLLHTKSGSERATIKVNAASWEALRQILAFLQTDLETQPSDCTRIVEARWDIVLWGLALTAAVVAGLCFVIGLHLWLLAIAWILFPPLTLLVSYFCEKDANDLWNPFDDDQQWREHEHLVERLNLPAYSPARHRTHWIADAGRCLGKTVWNFRAILFIPMVAVAVVLLLAYLLVTGPIWAVKGFRRREIPERRAVPGEVIGGDSSKLQHA